MEIGKNMILAIMITFCFTATLFLIIPIRSANSPYDPWLDQNDKGYIGLQDLVLLANSYGTTGDPTKNVNVTNWPVEITATNYLTTELNVSVIQDAGQNGGIFSNSSEINIGGNNITLIGGDVSGGLTWEDFFYPGSTTSMTSGFSQATGRAELFDSGGNLVGEFTLPENHRISVVNVDKIRLTIQAMAPQLRATRSFEGVGSATLYWVQS